MAWSRPEKLSSSLKRRELYDGTDGTSWDRGRLGFIYTILLCEMSLFPYIYDLAASTCTLSQYMQQQMSPNARGEEI